MEPGDPGQVLPGRFPKSRQPQASTGGPILPQTEIGELIHLLGRNQEASEEFFRRFHRPIKSIVVRTLRRFGSANADAVEERVQEVFLKLLDRDGLLLKKTEFQHEGAVFGFIKQLARNVVVDYCRATGPGTRQLEPGVEIGACPGRRIASPQIERQILYEQVERVLCENATQQEHKIFSLYYRDGMTASEISRLPGIDLTVKGVECTLLRLTRLVRSRLAANDGRKVRKPKRLRRH